jgi:hypothetical protein
LFYKTIPGFRGGKSPDFAQGAQRRGGEQQTRRDHEQRGFPQVVVQQAAREMEREEQRGER